MKTYIGFDNGVTATVGIITIDKSYFFKIPVFIQQNYTKAKQNITRIDVVKLMKVLKPFLEQNPFALIERPFTGMNIKTVSSGMRALEAVLIVLELYQIGYAFTDSKSWQRELLPKGVKGTDLKKASRDIGIRMFPEHRELIEKHGDSDGLLIAEYARRNL